MGTATVKWIQGKQFVGIDSTQHSVVLSTADEGVGIKPSDLLLIAVGSCTAVDVVEILTKKRMPLTRLEIRVSGEQDQDPPWTFRKIHMHFTVGGLNLTEKAVTQAIQLSEEKYCSVAATLRDTAQITTDFEIIEQTDKIKLINRWQGVVLPYTFIRTLTLASDSSVIRVDYEVMSRVDQPIHFVWSIHPLLAIEPGMRLHLPQSARFNVAGSFPQDLVSQQKDLQYPFAASGLNFPALPDPSTGRAIKIWSDPLPADSGWAMLLANNGQLKMRWDVALLPQVGAWMNFGAWAADGGTPYYNLGLEPCIGAQDSLADAVTQYNLFATLPPYGSKAWWLEIELTI